MITLDINNRQIQVEEAGIKIPTLCNVEHSIPKGDMRLITVFYF